MSRKKEYPALFEQFWKAYPKRNGRRVGSKPLALKKWRQLLPSEQKELITAAVNYGAEVDSKFVRYPERFLKDYFWHSYRHCLETKRRNVKSEAEQLDLMKYELRRRLGWAACADWIDDVARVRLEFQKLSARET